MLDGIRHVIWDWNGTLFDDVDAALLSINTMLGERGLPLLGRQSYREVFGFPVIDCYRVLGFEFDTDREWDAIANEFHGHYNRIAEESLLTEGARDVLDSLVGRGIAMSVLSASESNTLSGLLKRYGLGDYFEHVFGLDNLYGSSKMDLGQQLMEQLDVAQDEVLRQPACALRHRAAGEAEVGAQDQSTARGKVRVVVEKDDFDRVRVGRLRHEVVHPVAWLQRAGLVAVRRHQVRAGQQQAVLRARRTAIEGSGRRVRSGWWCITSSI